ncbi:MAG: tetratricopeptide repeat-containing protein [Sphingobacteriia bacterium]|nr:tetratricopeptide repeat-containing protein [Sphingobacteriia bacterium]
MSLEARTFLNNAVQLLMQNNIDAGINELFKCLQCDPNNIRALVFLSDHLRSRNQGNDIQIAIRCCLDILNLTRPLQRLTVRNMACESLAEIYMSLNQRQEALKYYKQSIERLNFNLEDENDYNNHFLRDKLVIIKNLSKQLDVQTGIEEKYNEMGLFFDHFEKRVEKKSSHKLFKNIFLSISVFLITYIVSDFLTQYFLSNSYKNQNISTNTLSNKLSNCLRSIFEKSKNEITKKGINI